MRDRGGGRARLRRDREKSVGVQAWQPPPTDLQETTDTPYRISAVVCCTVQQARHRGQTAMVAVAASPVPSPRPVLSPLGTNTGFGANPPPLPFPTDAARLARAERYDLQRVAREVLGSDHRIRGCLRYRHFGATHVAVRNRRDTGQAYYSGLQVCAVSRRFRTATCVAPKCR